MVFKKDLTPPARGQVIKHRGKGSSPVPPRPMMDQMTRRYPKPALQLAPGPALQPAPGSAMAPPPGMGAPPEEV